MPKAMLKKMRIFKIIIGKIKRLLVPLYKLAFIWVPFKDDVIIFESGMFRNYTGNPRYIYEELVRQGLDQKYQCIWVLRKNSHVMECDIPGNRRIIRYKTSKFFYFVRSAHFIVSDNRLPRYVFMNKKKIYIQTWHGTPLKKLALDMDNLDMGGSTNIKKYHRNIRKNSATWDYLITQNRFSTDIFRRCFAFDRDYQEFLEYGYPRNDKLINSTADDIESIKIDLGLPLDKKIILYAPTWRDNEYYDKGEYKFICPIDFDELRRKLSDEYVIIVKYHYLIKDTVDWSQYDGFVYNFSEESDIADLYLVSDMLITDYSSVMFDYGVLNRPMIFFTYDLEEYKDSLRGFYFDFVNEAPGPLVIEPEHLADAILDYNPAAWVQKHQAFHDKFNTFDDGHASERVVDIIKSKM